MSAFFTNTDTIATSRALIVFAMGLPAFVCVKIFQVMFFSRENTRSPMIFAGFTVLANIFISLALFQYLGYLGIAIATTISSWINLILLYRESAAKNIIFNYKIIKSYNKNYHSFYSMILILFLIEKSSSILQFSEGYIVNFLILYATLSLE